MPDNMDSTVLQRGFVEAIDQRLRQLGWRRVDLARRLGVSASAVTRMLTRPISEETAQRLWKATAGAERARRDRVECPLCDWRGARFAIDHHLRIWHLPSDPLVELLLTDNGSSTEHES